VPTAVGVGPRITRHSVKSEQSVLQDTSQSPASIRRHELQQVAIRIAEVDRQRRHPVGGAPARRTLDDRDPVLAQQIGGALDAPGPLEQLLGEGVLKDADALVLDLRAGWGRAVPDYLDLFDARAPTIRIRDRNGRTRLDNVKWQRPAVMLVNERTRSTVLAASTFLMRNGDLLLLLAVDVRVDGERLEGTGVGPTIAVPFDSRYAACTDPQLDHAVAVLSHR
jgi:hypothetical protein